MFRFLLKKRNNFYLFFIILSFIAWLLFVEKVAFENAIPFVLIALSFVLNIATLQTLVVIRKNFWVPLLLLLFSISFYETLLTLPNAIAYSIVSFAILVFLYHRGTQFYFLNGFLLSFAVINSYAAIGICLFFLSVSFFYSETKLKIGRFLFGMFMGFFATVQVLYLLDETQLFDEFFCNLQLYIPTFTWKIALLIPVALLLLISMIDLLRKSNVQAIEKRIINRIVGLLVIGSLVSISVFSESIYSHLYYISLPFTVMISRYIQYEKNKWMVEISIGITIVSLSLYIVNEHLHHFLA